MPRVEVGSWRAGPRGERLATTRTFVHTAPEGSAWLRGAAALIDTDDELAAQLRSRLETAFSSGALPGATSAGETARYLAALLEEFDRKLKSQTRPASVVLAAWGAREMLVATLGQAAAYLYRPPDEGEYFEAREGQSPYIAHLHIGPRDTLLLFEAEGALHVQEHELQQLARATMPVDAAAAWLAALAAGRRQVESAALVVRFRPAASALGRLEPQVRLPAPKTMFFAGVAAALLVAVLLFVRSFAGHNAAGTAPAPPALLTAQPTQAPALAPAPTPTPARQPAPTPSPTPLTIQAPTPVPAPTRAAAAQQAMVVYQSEVLAVIVAVNTAENRIGAALAAVRNGAGLSTARTDVNAAVADLRYARKQLNGVTPPASMAGVHRDVEGAIGVLVDGAGEVANGIDKLNSQESTKGLRRFNQGLADLRRAARILQHHPAAP